jgi:O-methyltransferase domain/Dimerisation domain
MGGAMEGVPVGPTAESGRRLLELVQGFRLSQALYVVTSLGIPDLLAHGARELEDLTQATGSHAPSLYRVLRALTGAGVFDEIGPRRFALTPVGTGLRSDVAGSLRTQVLMWLDAWNWRSWGQLAHTTRSGETAFRHTHGMEIFGYLATHPELAATFDAAMTGQTAAQAPAIADAYPFSALGRVVDVGGGRGKLLATILRRHPRLRGVLFDLPHVVEGARALLLAEGVADRCQLVGGSFFESVPGGGDLYILRSIVHDWEDDRAVTILANCRRAMSDGARLLLVERYLSPDPHEALPVLLTDLEMLVNIGGRERTTDEYTTLLARSGLRLARTIALGPGVSHHLIEATPA